MKIAIDLDGTYHADKPLFNMIAARFKQAGHSVGILTSRHPSEGTQVEFTPDFVLFLDIGQHEYGERAAIKAETMRQETIDIVFDDHASYFPPSTVALHIL